MASRGKSGSGGGFWDSFEEFTERRSWVRSTEPRVALYRNNGTFALNRAAYEALGNADRIVFFYDAATRTIGIKKSPGPLLHSYPLANNPSSPNSFTTNGIAFLRMKGIPVTHTRVWEPAEVVEGGLVLPLDTAEVREHTSLASEIEDREPAQV